MKLKQEQQVRRLSSKVKNVKCRRMKHEEGFTKLILVEV